MSNQPKKDNKKENSSIKRTHWEQNTKIDQFFNTLNEVKSSGVSAIITREGREKNHEGISRDQE